MDFSIPKEITDLLARIDDFIEREIVPLQKQDDNDRFFDHRREWARTDFEHGGLPRKEWEALLREMRVRADKAGFLRLALPEEYGGKNIGNLAMAIIREHLAAKGLGLHNDLQNETSVVGNFPQILMMRDFGTEEQKKTLLPGMLNGTMRIAFGLTEPKHGSDATWMETRAVKDGNGWRINGEKMWNTGVHVATHDMVFCRTSRQGRRRARPHLPHRADERRGREDRRVYVDLQHADRSRARVVQECVGAGRRGVRAGRQRPRARAPLRAREPHPPGGLGRRRGAVLHQREHRLRQHAQAVRQAAVAQPGDPVAAGRAADRMPR